MRIAGRLKFVAIFLFLSCWCQNADSIDLLGDLQALYKSIDRLLDRVPEDSPTIKSAKSLYKILNYFTDLENVESADPDVLLGHFIQIQELVLISPDSPVDALIISGILPALVWGLQSENPELQRESAELLTIITGESQTIAVIDANAVPHLINLLHSKDYDIVQKALMTLNNIIVDGAYHRDICIKSGIVQPLIELLGSDVPEEVLRVLSLVLTNLVRHKHSPLASEIMDELLPEIKELLNQDDEDILTNALNGISHVTKSGSEQIQMVIDADIVPELIPFLKYKDDAIVYASLGALAEVASGSSKQIQTVLDLNVLDFIPGLLWHAEEKINKLAMFLLSNVAAGTSDQIQSIIDADLFPMIRSFLEHGDHGTQVECIWTIANMAKGATAEQIHTIFPNGPTESLCAMLMIEDIPIVKVALEGLDGLTEKLPEERSKMLRQMINCGGLDKVEKLRIYENKEVYTLATTLLHKLSAGKKKGYSNGNSMSKWLKLSIEHFVFYFLKFG